MKNLFLFLFFSTVFCIAQAQTRINGSFEFQTDSAKKYSLYIPSGYDENIPNRLMIGFHPFNTSRWDAESWCDTLINFAEANNLILACPDGGPDGQVDNPIDTAFTSALMDSVFLWYTINPDKVYAMGFSVGGRATYTYGLNHIEKFRGFIPIGAAINGVSEVNAVIQNAEGKPYYLVHGSNDSPGTRYTPIKAALEDNNALVNSILMSGIGHTIDFPNRNEILTTAFEWIDSVNCAVTTSINNSFAEKVALKIYPNPIAKDQRLTLFANKQIDQNIEISVYNVAGERVLNTKIDRLFKGSNHLPLSINSLDNGTYFLHLKKKTILMETIPFVVH